MRFSDLAVLEHVADTPDGRAQVVLEHEVARRRRRGSGRCRRRGRRCRPGTSNAASSRAGSSASRGRARRARSRPRGSAGRGRCRARNRLSARSRCSRPALDPLPLVGRHDPRHEVEREDPLGAGVVAVDRERDALREEEGVGDPDPLSELGGAHRREALREQAVVRPRLARTSRTSRRRTLRGRSRRSGRRRPRLRHRLRSRGGVLHPAPFTSYAGRCSGDSLTAFALYRLAHGTPPLPEVQRPAAAAAAPVDPHGRTARGRDAEDLRRPLEGGAADRASSGAAQRDSSPASHARRRS